MGQKRAQGFIPSLGGHYQEEEMGFDSWRDGHWLLELLAGNTAGAACFCSKTHTHQGLRQDTAGRKQEALRRP